MEHPSAALSVVPVALVFCLTRSAMEDPAAALGNGSMPVIGESADKGQ